MKRARLLVPLLASWVLPGCGMDIDSLPGMNAVPQEVVDIINAIDRSDLRTLKELLEGGATPTPPGSVLSPIHAAIKHFDSGKLVCDSAALKLLLDHGADANFIDQQSKMAPLEEALSMGDMLCAELLRKAGARIDRPGLTGDSIMTFAVRGAIRTGDTGILAQVVSWGGDVNARSEGGWTPLFQAAARPGGEFAAMELLRLGSDPCLRNSGGITALERAQGLVRALGSSSKSHSPEFLVAFAKASEHCKRSDMD